MKVKSREEREQIVNHVLMKLSASGTDDDAYLAVRELKRLLQAYVDNEDHMPGFTGKIPFPELNTHFVYVLPMRACNQSYVELVDPRKPEGVVKKGFRKPPKRSPNA
jgi:hypothetical protein